MREEAIIAVGGGSSGVCNASEAPRSAALHGTIIAGIMITEMTKAKINRSTICALAIATHPARGEFSDSKVVFLPTRCRSTQFLYQVCQNYRAQTPADYPAAWVTGIMS
jgi:hypothetical protein